MPSQQEAQVRERRRSSGDRRTPDRYCQRAKGTERLFVRMVCRLAPDEK